MNTQITQNPVIIEQRAIRKNFALMDILSLASGLRLPGADIHALAAFLTEREEGAHTTATQGKDAIALLHEQLPFLKSVDFTPLHNAMRHNPGRFDDTLRIWTDTQLLRYGTEHTLSSASKWALRKNSHKL
jgi:hypothetical protein